MNKKRICILIIVAALAVVGVVALTVLTRKSTKKEPFSKEELIEWFEDNDYVENDVGDPSLAEAGYTRIYTIADASDAEDFVSYMNSTGTGGDVFADCTEMVCGIWFDIGASIQLYAIYEDEDDARDAFDQLMEIFTEDYGEPDEEDNNYYIDGNWGQYLSNIKINVYGMTNHQYGGAYLMDNVLLILIGQDSMLSYPEVVENITDFCEYFDLDNPIDVKETRMNIG